MKTVIWTLWLATSGAISPLATFSDKMACIEGIAQIHDGLRVTYGDTKDRPNPGVLFCVPGAPVKQ